MAKETDKRYCRVCDRELKIIPEEPENDQHVPLYHCKHCERFYRFILVD
jgi:hypothetical protein